MRSSPSALPERVRPLLAVRRYAHRGRHGGPAVENSPSAFAAAIRAGEGIECDVRPSADGVPFVFHDAQLDRLIGRPGRFDALDARVIGRLRLVGGGEAIPRLSDLLAQVAGQVPLLVELKVDRGRRAAPLCRAVAEVLAGYDGSVGVMSFDPRVGGWFARHAPQIVRGLVISEVRGSRWGRRLALWRARPDFLAYDVRSLPSPLASAARARGLPIFAWTVTGDAVVPEADRLIHEDVR